MTGRYAHVQLPFRARCLSLSSISIVSEFIEVDKKESGLECLNDVIHSKKHRQTWTTTHEHIMKLFVELCVDLQRSAFAKDGLYQYRNICREVSLHSFEVVSPLPQLFGNRTKFYGLPYVYNYSSVVVFQCSYDGFY